VMLAILVERDHAHGGVDADEYISDGFEEIHINKE